MKYLKIFENFDIQLSEEIEDILNSLTDRTFYYNVRLEVSEAKRINICN